MKVLGRFVLVAVSVAILPALALCDEASHRAAAEEALKQMNWETIAQATCDRLVDGMIRGDPSLLGYRSDLRKWAAKHLGWKSVKDALVEIWMDEFSESELKEIAAFCRTDAGRKMNRKFPSMLAKERALLDDRILAMQAEVEETILKEELRPRTSDDAVRLQRSR